MSILKFLICYLCLNKINMPPIPQSFCGNVSNIILLGPRRNLGGENAGLIITCLYKGRCACQPCMYKYTTVCPYPVL